MKLPIKPTATRIAGSIAVEITERGTGTTWLGQIVDLVIAGMGPTPKTEPSIVVGLPGTIKIESELTGNLSQMGVTIHELRTPAATRKQVKIGHLPSLSVSGKLNVSGIIPLGTCGLDIKLVALERENPAMTLGADIAIHDDQVIVGEVLSTKHSIPVVIAPQGPPKGTPGSPR